MTDTDQLLSREQVAALLAISVRSVRRYTDTGRLPSVHIGRNVRYRLVDVERLITEQKATRGQDSPLEVQRPGEAAPGATGSTESVQEGPDKATGSCEGPGGATPLSEVSMRAVEVLREQLAAVTTENSALREEVARQAAEVARKAEAAGLWQGRALTLEAQLKQLTATTRERELMEAAAMRAVPEQATPSFWRRVWRAVRGGEVTHMSQREGA